MAPKKEEADAGEVGDGGAEGVDGQGVQGEVAGAEDADELVLSQGMEALGLDSIAF